MIKKVFAILGLLVFAIGLGCWLFNNNSYDIVNQLEKISSLEWQNPIDEFTDLIDYVMSFSTSMKNIDDVLDLVNLLGDLWKWFYKVIQLPVYLLKDLFVNLGNALLMVLYLLGF